MLASWSEQVPILSCYKPTLGQNTVGPAKFETERMMHWEFYSVRFTLCLMNSFIP